MDPQTASLFDTTLTPLAFTFVLTGVLVAAWRTYRQGYLAYWAGYWAAYVVVWPLFGFFYKADGSHHALLAAVLSGVSSLAGFAARAFFILGAIQYMEWRKPTRRALVAALGVATLCAAGGEVAR